MAEEMFPTLSEFLWSRGITDTEENLTAIAETLECLSGLEYIELLDYNRSAGGKYRACGMSFSPKWDESVPCNTDVQMFLARGVPIACSELPVEDELDG